MTKNETELTLIKLGMAMQSIVKQFAPNANHVSISSVNGTIHVRACQWDSVKSDYIEKDILKATLFEDGEIELNGEYIRFDEVVA